MKTDWSPLVSEMALWRAQGLTLPLWWRDDDAVEDTAAFQRLAQMARDLALPVHVAVIPKHAQPALVTACAATPWAVPLVHGWAHENKAPEGEKKAEFGHPRPHAEAETALALSRMTQMFGDAFLPIFVPPWNRVDPDLVALLPHQGYIGLSTYLPRAARLAAPGLVQINTHMDPIHWRGGGGLVPPEIQIAALVQNLSDRRTGQSDASEPLGFLTHHLVHDDALWEFSRACLSVILENGAQPVNLLQQKDALP